MAKQICMLQRSEQGFNPLIQVFGFNDRRARLTEASKMSFRFNPLIQVFGFNQANILAWSACHASQRFNPLIQVFGFNILATAKKMNVPKMARVLIP